jgi:hypothetical protein
LDKTGGGALHRTAQTVKKFADMARMIVHTKLLVDNVSQDWRSPDSRVESVSDRAAFNDVVEMLALFWSQLARASAAMAFLNPFRAMFIPVANPGVNAGAMNVEQIGNLGRGKSISAEKEGLEPQSDARSLVGLGFLAQD